VGGGHLDGGALNGGLSAATPKNTCPPVKSMAPDKFLAVLPTVHEEVVEAVGRRARHGVDGRSPLAKDLTKYLRCLSLHRDTPRWW